MGDCEEKRLGAVIAWLLGSRIGRALSAVLTAIGVAFAVFTAGKREGRRNERHKAKEADHENAADIRDRVDRNLDQRLREMDGRGFRD